MLHLQQGHYVAVQRLEVNGNYRIILSPAATLAEIANDFDVRLINDICLQRLSENI